MQNFWVVTLFHFQPSRDQWLDIESKALLDHHAMGIEEFSLNEAQVDAILGERSYSGGDLPQEVIDEVEARVLEKPTNYRFFFSTAGDAQDFNYSVKTNCLCESQVEECPGEDWNAEWKKHYAPILINEQLEIIPSWQKDYKSHSKEQIYINPGMGFGTGSHETTFLCLKLFTENVLTKSKIETVLDFGSGSGILGLSALKFFLEAKIDFYDIDVEANKNCYHNSEINHLSDKSFRLLLPEVRNKLQSAYDLVFANILESILMMEKDFLIETTKPSGYLILSGLLKPQVEGIVEAYSSEKLKLIRRTDKGDWSALLFQKEAL